MEKLINITGKALSGEWGSDDEEGFGIPVLRTTNFTNDGIIDFSNVVTRKITKNNIEEKYLKKGDIIIEKSGGSDNQPVGRVVYFDAEDNKYLFNNFTGLLRVKDTKKWVPKYVFYSLFANHKKGGTKKYENRTTGLHNLQTDAYVKEFKLREFSYLEQVQICKLFDKLTDLIDKRKKQLEKLDELVKSRFVEMFGDPISNPNNYQIQKYGELFELNAGGTPSKTIPEYWENGTISWIGSNMCQNQIIYENDGKYISQKGYDNSSARLFPIDTVLIALVGATIGKTALLKFETATNQNVLGVRNITEHNYNPMFVFCYTQFLYQKFIDIGNGEFKMASKGFVSELPMYIIDIEEQNRFADFVNQVEKSKTAVKNGLEKLELLKNALMQEYFG